MACFFGHEWILIVPTKEELERVDATRIPDRAHDRVCAVCGITDPRFQRVMRGILSMRRAGCLGLDHAWSGPPLLFETMVFGGELDEFQERYTSKPDALAGHARAVARVLQALALRKP